jgi:osmoprotectant transport system substrate-binding protein
MARITATLLAGALLAGCGSASGGTISGPSTRRSDAPGAPPGTGRPLVTIGDKNFTEQFILGELYAQALKAQGFAVVLNRDIGPTEVTLQALYSGRLSMYPEYLGTWNSRVARYRHAFRGTRSALAAARRFARARGLSLLDPTPFSDTGAIAVTRSYASANGLRTIGDLRKVAQSLSLGAPPQLQENAGGLPRLEQMYGFVPAVVQPLAIGSQYQALDHGTVQAAYVSTTDGTLRGRRYVLLGDPRGAFGRSQAFPVVPEKVLRAEGPAFARTLNRVTALLSLDTIRELNAAVDLQNRDPAQVARQFLQAHGLIPPPAG